MKYWLPAVAMMPFLILIPPQRTNKVYGFVDTHASIVATMENIGEENDVSAGLLWNLKID